MRHVSFVSFLSVVVVLLLSSFSDTGNAHTHALINRRGHGAQIQARLRGMDPDLEDGFGSETFGSDNVDGDFSDDANVGGRDAGLGKFADIVNSFGKKLDELDDSLVSTAVASVGKHQKEDAAESQEERTTSEASAAADTGLAARVAALEAFQRHDHASVSSAAKTAAVEMTDEIEAMKEKELQAHSDEESAAEATEAPSIDLLEAGKTAADNLPATLSRLDFVINAADARKTTPSLGGALRVQQEELNKAQELLLDEQIEDDRASKASIDGTMEPRAVLAAADDEEVALAEAESADDTQALTVDQMLKHLRAAAHAPVELPDQWRQTWQPPLPHLLPVKGPPGMPMTPLVRQAVLSANKDAMASTNGAALPPVLPPPAADNLAKNATMPGPMAISNITSNNSSLGLRFGPLGMMGGRIPPEGMAGGMAGPPLTGVQQLEAGATSVVQSNAAAAAATAQQDNMRAQQLHHVAMMAHREAAIRAHQLQHAAAVAQSKAAASEKRAQGVASLAQNLTAAATSQQQMAWATQQKIAAERQKALFDAQLRQHEVELQHLRQMSMKAATHAASAGQQLQAAFTRLKDNTANSATALMASKQADLSTGGPGNTLPNVPNGMNVGLGDMMPPGQTPGQALGVQFGQPMSGGRMGPLGNGFGRAPSGGMMMGGVMPPPIPPIPPVLPGLPAAGGVGAPGIGPPPATGAGFPARYNGPLAQGFPTQFAAQYPQPGLAQQRSMGHPHAPVDIWAPTTPGGNAMLNMKPPPPPPPSPMAEASPQATMQQFIAAR